MDEPLAFAATILVEGWTTNDDHSTDQLTVGDKPITLHVFSEADRAKLGQHSPVLSVLAYAECDGRRLSTQMAAERALGDWHAVRAVFNAVLAYNGTVEKKVAPVAPLDGAEILATALVTSVFNVAAKRTNNG